MNVVYGNELEINIGQNNDIIQFKFEANLYNKETLFITYGKNSFIPFRQNRIKP